MFRCKIAFCLLLATTGPSAAASVTTLSFVADARSANEVIVRANALAEANGASRHILAFARREADRESVIATFTDWAVAEQVEADKAAHAPTIDGLGPLFGEADRLTNVVIPPLSLNLPPSRGPNVGALASLRGGDFDALYARAQVAMLTRLVAAYKDFIKNGDDETLRRLAVRDLPRAEGLLAAARRL